LLASSFIACLLENYKIIGSKYTKENTNKLIETTVFFPTKWAACHYQVKHAVHKFIIQYYWYQPSMAACATFIYDYSPIGYIAGVCEVYALWYDFFLKLLLS
jgi:hypothetical protein